jgi:hypothetical protein
MVLPTFAHTSSAPFAASLDLSLPGVEIREANTRMIQTATKLAYGAAILVLSLILAVPLRAEDASKVPSGLVSNPCGAIVPGAKISPKNEIPVRVEYYLAEAEIT